MTSLLLLLYFRIRIHRSRMFCGLPDPHPDPYKNATDPRYWCKYCVLFRRCARTTVRTRLCWPAWGGKAWPTPPCYPSWGSSSRRRGKSGPSLLPPEPSDCMDHRDWCLSHGCDGKWVNAAVIRNHFQESCSDTSWSTGKPLFLRRKSGRQLEGILRKSVIWRGLPTTNIVGTVLLECGTIPYVICFIFSDRKPTK